MRAKREFADLDGSRTIGGNQTHSATHGNTASGVGYGSSTTTGAGYGSTNAGPHSSNLTNKADPRVDSDLDNRGAYGSSTTTGAGYGSATGAGHSTTGAGYGSTNAGPHSSNLGNKTDPRIDSDRDNRGAYGASSTSGVGSHSTATSGAGYGSTTSTGVPGPAPTTAGPHKSDMMNKADPRVDSNLDGSKTYGGNKTLGYVESPSYYLATFF